MADGTDTGKKQYGAVLRNEEDVEVWKYLDRIDKAKEKSKKAEFGKLRNYLEKIQKKNELIINSSGKSNKRKKESSKKVTYLSSSVVSRIIWTHAEIEKNWDESLDFLFKFVRMGDILHKLAAVQRLHEDGRDKDAKNQFRLIEDNLSYEYIYTRALIGNGSAKSHEDLLHCFYCNPSDERLLKLLPLMDNHIDWYSLNALEHRYNGEPFDVESSKESSNEYKLYMAYCLWRAGNLSEAKKIMTDKALSGEYREIVQARMWATDIKKDQVSDDDKKYVRSWYGSVKASTEKTEKFKLLSSLKRLKKSEKEDTPLLEDDVEDFERDVNSAIRVYRTLLDRLNDNGEERFSLQCELGELYLSCRKADDALPCFESALLISPESIRARKGIIESYSMKLDTASAHNNIGLIINSEFTTLDDLKYCAEKDYELRHSEEAMAIADLVLKSSPKDADMLVLISNIHLKAGRYKKAKKYAEMAARSDSCNADCYAQISDVYFTLRRNAAAMNAAKKAIVMDANSINANVAMMVAFSKFNKMDRVAEFSSNVLRLDPFNARARDMVVKYNLSKGMSEDLQNNEGVKLGHIRSSIEEGDYEKARQLCVDEIKLNKASSDFYMEKGIAEYKLGYYSDASESFKMAAELCMENPNLWYYKGISDEKAGKLKDAEEAIGKALLSNMDNPEYWVSDGFVKEKLGNPVGAVRSYNHAISLAPKELFALVRKAVIFADNNKPLDALHYIELAENVDKKNVVVLKTKIKILYQAEKYSDVEKIGEKLLKTVNDPWVSAYIAMAHIREEDYHSARKVLKRALNNHPNDMNVLIANRELMIRERDMDSAIPLAKKIYEMDKTDRENAVIYRDLLLNLGQCSEAACVQVPEITIGGDTPGDLLRFNSSDYWYDNATKARDKGDIAEARNNIDKAIQLDPENGSYIVFKAKLYSSRGDRDCASNLLKEYLNRYPDNAAVLQEHGDIMKDMGDQTGELDCYHNAIEAYTKATTLIQTFTIYSKLADCFLNVGNREEAMNCYKSILQISPDEAQTSRDLARLQIDVDPNEALKTLNTSVELTKEYTRETYALYIIIYGHLGNIQKMDSAYIQYWRFDDPIDDDLMGRLKEILRKKGRIQEARRLEPGSDDVEDSMEPETVNEGSVPDEPENAVPVEPKVKDAELDERILSCSVRMLKHAYLTGTSIDDQSVIDSVSDYTDEELNAALDYLYDVPECETMVFEGEKFLRMEKYSLLMLSRAGRGFNLTKTDLPTVYTTCDLSIDEAKNVVTYVNTAMTAELSECPQSILKDNADLDPDCTLEELMIKSGLGVYQARMLRAALNNLSSQTS